MNIFIMSRQSPGPARPAHTRPRPGPSPMCLPGLDQKPGPRRALIYISLLNIFHDQNIIFCQISAAAGVICGSPN